MLSICLFVTPAFALNRGDVGYMCYKKGWNLWGNGGSAHQACQVRVLENNGGNILIQHEGACYENAGVEGQTEWISSGQLYETKSSCEGN